MRKLSTIRTTIAHRGLKKRDKRPEIRTHALLFRKFTVSAGWGGRSTRHATAALVAVALLAGGALTTSAVPLAAQLRYEREYPSIEYSTRTRTDRVAQLRDRIEGGMVELAFEERGGYLTALLEQLDISVSSQTLVFTRTSLQARQISPRRPRAIYFNDDVYVAWVQGSEVIEISAVDPVMGGVFYTLGQDTADAGDFVIETGLCLECHDSYGLTGGGAPRHLVGSMLPDASGRAVYHEGWRLTDDRTPLRERWGGWYVTGTHGDVTHRGNVIVSSPEDVSGLDFAATGNREELSDLVDTSPYLSGHSDIVALLVLEHQVHVQNEITRLGYDARTSLYHDEVEGRSPAPGDTRASAETLQVIATVGEGLIRAMLLVDEAPLEANIEGTSGFAEQFELRGVPDNQGRSLRDLNLRRRLFEYPLSYLIYSRSFDALPGEAKAFVYRRLAELLGGDDRPEDYAHISEAQGRAILDILRDTKPDFPVSR
jgi:hypothetical protein